MIVVNITPTGLTIDGHAGYTKTGNDIICASVSILAQSLVNSIESFTGDQLLCQVEGRAHGYKMEDLSEQGKLLIDSLSWHLRNLQHIWGELRKTNVQNVRMT